MTGTEAAARRVAIVIVSTRAAAGAYLDRTGPIIAGWAADRGWASTLDVVPDGPEVARVLRAALDSGAELVVSSGGTGVSPTDRTVEAARPLVERELPGIMEELRRRGATHSPHALLSRGVAGVAGHSLLVTLPGSPGGVRDGLAVLDGLVEHVLDQLAGGDHAAPDPEGRPTTGAERVRLARITEAPIAVDLCATAVAGPADGAVVTFAGVVRNHDGGRDVEWLEYTAHPDAGEILDAICADVAARHPRTVLAAAHRTGRLEIGELALAVAVASAHRREAFAACAELVDAIKAGVPVWKEQFFAGGEHEWVGSLG